MPKHRSTNALLHVKNGQRGSSSSWPSLPSVRIPVSICGPILEPVTPVTAPINIGPSSPLQPRKISACYDLENHKTLANIDLLRLLRLLRLNSGPGGKSFSLSAAPGPLATISALISPCASVQFPSTWCRFVVKLL